MSSINYTQYMEPSSTVESSMQFTQQSRPSLKQPHPHHPRSTSPIDFYPEEQQPIASSSSSHFHRRAPSSTTSSTSTHGYDPEDAYYPPPSTAPTTPDLTSTPARQWRPTQRVPLHIARRHRATQPRDRSLDMSRDDRVDDRNRWLSEDEGVGGGNRSGRRRRRRSGDDGNTAASGPGDDEDEEVTIPAPATGSSRVGGMVKPSVKSRSPRPIVRRAMSHEGPSLRAGLLNTAERVDYTTMSGGVGGEPPRIQDIVPGPSNVGRKVDKMVDRDSGRGSGWDRNNTRDSEELEEIGSGSGSESSGNDEVKKARGRQRELLERLRKILGCALCPPGIVETPPPALHHPITLPCGHTLSLSHLTLPPLPPLGIPLTAPPHEIAAAQQRQQQKRLQIWLGVMCPIPTCKRYSPSMSNSPHVDHVVADIEVPSPPRNSSSVSVNHYTPPPVVTQPAHTQVTAEITNAHTPAGSPLLDVCVDKVLHVVLKEIEKFDRPQQSSMLKKVLSSTGLHLDLEATDSEGDMPTASSDKSNTSQHLEELGHNDLLIAAPANMALEAGPPSPLVRRSSKRRKNNINSENGGATMMDRVASAGGEGWGFMKDLGRVVECDVCALLLYEPVTTPCQHSFCSKCLSRSLDHSSRCPVCRQDLPSFAFFQDHPVNKVLLTIIKTAFPEEYVDRAQAIERDSRDQLLDTPLFVCTLAFPGMPTILHVFEPRYRLMIRRACESSNPRFGMLLPARPGDGGPAGMSEYGTMLEIQSVQVLPDGRSMVETVGSFRFRLLEKGSLDGYTIGRVERIDDISPEEERRLEVEAVERAAVARSMVALSTGVTDSTAPIVQHAQDGSTLIVGSSGTSTPSTNIPRPPLFPQPAQATPQIPSNSNLPHSLIQPGGAPPPTEDPALQAQTTEELLATCREFIEQLRSGSAPWLLQRLNNTYGSMPEGADEFSYWMALVMPIDEYEKARLLPIRSPRLRLKLIVHWVESLKSSWW